MAFVDYFLALEENSHPRGPYRVDISETCESEILK